MKRLSKKRSFKHFKRKTCPCGPRCLYSLRRIWLGKKFGIFKEEEMQGQ